MHAFDEKVSLLRSDTDTPRDRYVPTEETGERRLLDLNYDAGYHTLWKFIGRSAPVYFSHPLIDEIRSVQERIGAGDELDVSDYELGDIEFCVFGSRLPGVFSLGGDLALFRELILRRDRAGLAAYAKKATDGVWANAIGFGQNVFTVALVQGTALGGGFELALSAQSIVAERGTKFGLPETLFGLFPGMGAYTLLKRRVDARTAERMIASGDTFCAEELHEMGIIDVLCYPGEGEEAVQDFISRQRRNPGYRAFRQALTRVNAINRDELYGMADEWVSAALELGDGDLRRIDRLVRNQQRMTREVESFKGRSFAPGR